MSNIPTDSIPWPMGDKVQDSIPSNVDSIRLELAVQNLFRETDTTSPNRTMALIVVYDDNIIVEKYAPGFSKNTRLTGWSMTKSITSAIIGVLVKQNGWILKPLRLFRNGKKMMTLVTASLPGICFSKQQDCSLKKSIRRVQMQQECFVNMPIWELTQLPFICSMRLVQDFITVVETRIFFRGSYGGLSETTIITRFLMSNYFIELACTV